VKLLDYFLYVLRNHTGKGIERANEGAPSPLATERGRQLRWPLIGRLAKPLDNLPLLIGILLSDLPSLILARQLGVGWLFFGWLVVLGHTYPAN